MTELTKETYNILKTISKHPILVEDVKRKDSVYQKRILLLGNKGLICIRGDYTWKNQLISPEKYELTDEGLIYIEDHEAENKHRILLYILTNVLVPIFLSFCTAFITSLATLLSAGK